eukprot:1377226-Pyramimonas_sp.AAC.1
MKPPGLTIPWLNIVPSAVHHDSSRHAPCGVCPCSMRRLRFPLPAALNRGGTCPGDAASQGPDQFEAPCWSTMPGGQTLCGKSYYRYSSLSPSFGGEPAGE